MAGRPEAMRREVAGEGEREETYLVPLSHEDVAAILSARNRLDSIFGALSMGTGHRARLEGLDALNDRLTRIYARFEWAYEEDCRKKGKAT